ncbi:hypothetical protein ABGV42_01025 [Paenibacillus pabuli]|uniref:hypothetical protein n=1 Tax=Paenibacillus pabuli TaxID=1472 RepID=UPI003241E06E
MAHIEKIIQDFMPQGDYSIVGINSSLVVDYLLAAMADHYASMNKSVLVLSGSCDRVKDLIARRIGGKFHLDHDQKQAIFLNMHINNYYETHVDSYIDHCYNMRPDVVLINTGVKNFDHIEVFDNLARIYFNNPQTTLVNLFISRELNPHDHIYKTARNRTIVTRNEDEIYLRTTDESKIAFYYYRSGDWPYTQDSI